jgi:hypothetical protein
VTDDLKTKLKNEIMTAPWVEIRPHWADRNSVIFVEAELDLVDVGQSIVTDNASQVETWLASHQISRPNESQIEAWDSSPEKSFRFLIVQPYVLIQDLGH